MDISKQTTSYGVDEDHSWLGSSHGFDAMRTGTLDVSTFTEGTHYPSGGGLIKSGTAIVRNSGSGLWEPWSANDPTSEVQTVTVDATGGTFTISLDGETSGTIAANASAATVQAALEAMSNIEVGDVTVTRSGSANAYVYTLTWAGDRAGKNVPAVTTGAGSLTGGAGTATVATSTAGAAATYTEVGLLGRSVKVVSSSSADVGVPIFEHGAVIESKLPSNHGVNAFFKTAAGSRIIFR